MFSLALKYWIYWKRTPKNCYLSQKMKKGKKNRITNVWLGIKILKKAILKNDNNCIFLYIKIDCCYGELRYKIFLEMDKNFSTIKSMGSNEFAFYNRKIEYRFFFKTFVYNSIQSVLSSWCLFISNKEDHQMRRLNRISSPFNKF